MTVRSRDLRFLCTIAVVLVWSARPAHAYIGPGAGFAAAGSVFVLLTTFLLAIGIVLIWPFKAAVRALTMPRRGEAKAKRVVVIGLDGSASMVYSEL